MIQTQDGISSPRIMKNMMLIMETTYTMYIIMHLFFLIQTSNLSRLLKKRIGLLTQQQMNKSSILTMIKI